MAAAVVVGIIIADMVSGVFGHVLALLVWVGAGWMCLGPARSKVKSAARTWARIGVAAFAVLAVYAGGLAIAGGDGAGSSGPGLVAGYCYVWETSPDGQVVMGSSIGTSCAGETSVLMNPQIDNGETWTPASTEPAHGALECGTQSDEASEPGGDVVYVGPNGASDNEAEAVCNQMSSDGLNVNWGG